MLCFLLSTLFSVTLSLRSSCTAKYQFYNHIKQLRVSKTFYTFLFWSLPRIIGTNIDQKLIIIIIIYLSLLSCSVGSWKQFYLEPVYLLYNNILLATSLLLTGHCCRKKKKSCVCSFVRAHNSFYSARITFLFSNFCSSRVTLRTNVCSWQHNPLSPLPQGLRILKWCRHVIPMK
jgi:hypothetical protein